MKKLIAVCFLALSLEIPASAYWFGNPAHPVKKGFSTLELVYDAGSRDVVRTNGQGSTAELETRRFTIQYRRALGDSGQVFGRVLPGTGRLNLENVGVNPVLWGGGLGLQLSPPEPMGIVRLGVVGFLDAGAGVADESVPGQGRDSVHWVEGAAAAGASVSPVDFVEAYGGISLIKSQSRFEIADTKTTLETDKTVGGFLGAAYLPNDSWTLATEFHFGNENLAGVMLGYSFE